MNYTDIQYLEASSNYTIFHFQDGVKQLHSYTLKHYEKLLIAHHAFSRIHRRFLVNRAFIASHSSTEVFLTSGKQLPLSRRRRFVVKTE
ncbi:LytTR family transcriptional regulator [Lacihabitans sp. LS3-19]|uniref:LytR/AlgR family response regulator transcription factor n=1 Tax=Lacihabitans sp. LS3-19 TaxID=2487335 RepID=UPI0020CD0445|nr:LytTR family DNA-binding domain-containing protein [Lacihabitans sp. LS3-19]MCP9767897.1 LytTR family transcriptional regulator [Lacihabitans sp. LS3-19]